MACASNFVWIGVPGARKLNRKVSISLCPYSATDVSSAKHFTVTLKPNNIFQGKWQANSHHLGCRKIPTSLPGLTAFKETLDWRSLYNQSDFFPHSLFVEVSFTQAYKKKIRRKSKEEENLNEKFQSCLCQNPPSPSQRPSPLIQASVFPGKGVGKLLKYILLLYWDWHLTGLCSVLTWVNLNDKLGFIRQGSSVTIEQHDCFVVEGKRGRIKVFFKSPVVPLTCQKVVTHSG